MEEKRISKSNCGAESYFFDYFFLDMTHQSASLCLTPTFLFLQ